jgi:ABC-2 type transport system permease protein
MSENEGFEFVTGTGWNRGLDNMLRSGLARWFKTKTWWIQCLIWGGLAAIFVSPSILLKVPPRLDESLMISFIFIGFFPAVGVIIIMQDAIVGEKREGTAAWVLSKPLTRLSFVLSKVIANCVGILVTMIFVPFCLSFAILSIGHHSSFFSLGFFEVMGVMFINHYFFLSMTLMLGSFFNSRGAVIGIPLAVLFLLPLAVLFFQQPILHFLPFLKYVLPWNLIVPLGLTNSLVISLAMGTPVQSYHMVLLLVIVLESVLFTLISIWRFNKEEF